MSIFYSRILNSYAPLGNMTRALSEYTNSVVALGPINTAPHEHFSEIGEISEIIESSIKALREGKSHEEKLALYKAIKQGAKEISVHVGALEEAELNNKLEDSYKTALSHVESLNDKFQRELDLRSPYLSGRPLKSAT